MSTNFDRSAFQQDPNISFPAERLREMADVGEIGGVSKWHYSFMGAVGALSSFIERAGVACTSISLVREQSEAVGPTRALWVPFALGWPLGSAEDPDFQKRVMRDAFSSRPLSQRLPTTTGRSPKKLARGSGPAH